MSGFEAKLLDRLEAISLRIGDVADELRRLRRQRPGGREVGFGVVSTEFVGIPVARFEEAARLVERISRLSLLGSANQEISDLAIEALTKLRGEE